MSEFDPEIAYEDLLDDLKKVVFEQISHLKEQSKKGKLSPAEYKTLRELIAQVKELAAKEWNAAMALTEEELQKAVWRGDKTKVKLRKNDENSDENTTESSDTEEEG